MSQPYLVFNKKSDSGVPSLYYDLVLAEKIIGILQLRLVPSARPELPDSMKSHIYYEIDGAERGKGFGNEILRLGLEEAAKEGLKEVVVTVESDNIPSKKIIEKNGGVFAESFDLKNGSKQLKYIFDLKRQ